MSFKLVTLFIFITLCLSAVAEDDVNYEKEFYLFIKTSPEVFKSNVNLYEEINGLNIDKELKSKLLDCALNEKHVYLREYIPFFKKHLTIEDMKSISAWLDTESGRLWINFHQGKVDLNSLSESQITVINTFAGSNVMKKLEVATEESIPVANVAGKKFAEYCSQKAGL